MVDGEIDLYVQSTHDNLDHVTLVERYDTDASSSSNLIGKQETKFDDLGRIYETKRYAVAVGSGTVGNALIDRTWYDAAGNVAKQQPAGSQAFTKTFYDGVGRPIKTFVGYDVSESSYADVLTVTGDTLFEQSETAYDKGGNTLLVTSRRRFHDATGTGELTSPSGSQPKARVSYMAMWHDGIGRTVAAANYGTNCQSARKTRQRSAGENQPF